MTTFSVAFEAIGIDKVEKSLKSVNKISKTFESSLKGSTNSVSKGFKDVSSSSNIFGRTFNSISQSTSKVFDKMKSSSSSFGKSLKKVFKSSSKEIELTGEKITDFQEQIDTLGKEGLSTLDAMNASAAAQHQAFSSATQGVNLLGFSFNSVFDTLVALDGKAQGAGKALQLFSAGFNKAQADGVGVFASLATGWKTMVAGFKSGSS